MARSNLLLDAVRGALHLNVLLAVGAASIVAATALIAHQSPPPLAMLVAFLSVFVVYNFDRLADRSDGDGTAAPRRSAMLKRIRTVVRVAVILCAGAVVLLAALSGGTAAAWIAAFPLAGVLYIAPLFPGRRLKDIPYLKSFYTPACWCIFVGVAIGVGHLVPDATMLYFAVFVFARIFVSGSLGDLRDVEVDARTGVRTLAVWLGRARCIVVLEIVQALTLLGWVAAALRGWVPLSALALLLPAAVAYGFFRSFIAGRGESELVLELYDLELVLLAPTLWLFI